ncbi:MAG TPA: lysylphosphatidylglycerol synthase transmembrane domain-containing protein [Clostridiaceae bacterium]|nr:lysylphosphatidylglycerol synthase transmembrane domain-containing protein [Clostridiaceae bacterium]
MNKAVKYIRLILTLIAIMIVAAVLLTKIASIEKAAAVIAALPVWMVGIAALTQVISYLGSGYQVKVIVNNDIHKISTIRGALITVAGESVGLAGGMAGSVAATYLWVAKDKDMSDEGVLAGVIPIIYNSVALLGFSTIGMVYLLINHSLSTTQIVFYGLILAVLVVGMIAIVYGLFRKQMIENFVLKTGDRVNRLSKRKMDLERIKNRMDNFYRSLALMKEKGWVKISTGTLINVGFDIITIYIFFVASGYSITPGVLVAGYCLSFLLGRSIFFIPGGSGVIEGGMVAIFINLGVPAPISVVAVLGYRFLSFWLPILIGFLIMIYLERSTGRKHG